MDRPSSPIYHGREAELQRLGQFHARLQRANFSRRALLVEATPGACANPLLDVFVAHAEEQGTLVLQAGGTVAGDFGALAPVRALLRSLAVQQPSLPAGQRLLGLLSRLDSPPFERGETHLLSSLSAREERLGLFESVRRLLWDAANHRHTLVVLRDVHRCDPDTLDFVRFLLDDLHNASILATPGSVRFRGLLLLSAERAPAPDAAAAAAADLPNVFGHPALDALPLGGLDSEGMARFLRRDDLLERLVALTGGQPCAVERLLAALPDDLDGLLEQRWSDLGPAERQVLAALLVLSSPADRARVAEVAGLTQLDVTRALRSLEKLRAVKRNAERYALGRLFDARWLEARLSPEEIATAHRHAAEVVALDAEAGPEPALLEETVRHLVGAGAGVEAMSPALQAARLFFDQLSPQRGLQVLTTALAAWPQNEPPHEALELLSELQERLGLYDDARRSAERLLRNDPHRALLHEARIAILRSRQHPGAALDDLHDARCRAEAVGNLRLAGTLSLALAESRWLAGEVGEAEQHASAALAGGSRLDFEVRLGAANLLGKVAFRRGAFDDAEARFRAVRDEAEGRGLGLDVARADHNLGLIALRRGRYEEARRLLDSVATACESHHELYGAAQALLNLGGAYEHLGRYALALQFLRRAAEAFETLGRRGELAKALGNLADLYLTAGDVRAARRLLRRAQNLDDAEQLAHDSAFHRLKSGELAIEEGRFGEAEPLLLEALQRFELDDNPVDTAGALLALALAAEGRGDIESCRGYLRRLRRLASDRLSEDQALGRLVEARLADAEDDLDAMVDALDEALPVLEEHRQRVGVAEALRLRAVWAERVGDSALAARSLAEARDVIRVTAESFGDPWRERFLERRVVRRVLDAGNAPARPTPPPVAPPPTPKAAPGESDDSLLARWRARFPGIVGHSRALIQVLKLVDRIAPCDAPVLLLGESGTGKELVAKAICRLSERAERPYIKVNAAALTETLLETELFGHERGAFTGADQRKAGKFEQAHGGTLFLDEIGDITPKMQVSLLRVLQEREFQRVGGIDPVRVDVRLIFATNRNLEQMVEAGTFRSDLYFRIRGLTIEIPALRNRAEDVPELVAHCLRQLEADGGRAVGIEPQAIALLRAAPWPGNVRELDNVLRSAYFLADGDTIGVADLRQHPALRDVSLPEPAASGAERGTPAAAGPGFSLAEAKREMEVRYITWAIDQAGGNITQAAKLLDMKRPRLSQKIKEYGIQLPGRGDQP